VSKPAFQIRPAEASDADAVLDVLERSLSADPFVRWLARPGPAHERARRSYLRLMLCRIALPRGRVYLAEADGRVVGAALWAPPRSFELSAADTLRLLPLMLDVVGFSRMTRVTRILDAIDAARPPEPRWLLTLVGTLPSERRRGIGAALLAPVLERCDADEVAAVLETANPDNLPFYRRLGFREAGRRALGENGPTSWTLVRPPKLR
jgi:GNAT superfamily N-acetyltransferase